MTETKICAACDAATPFEQCCAMGEDMSCARLAMYLTAKLPAYPLTDGDVWIHKDDYDKLRVYASRLAVDLSLLNGIIHRAARDAQKYVDAAERSIDHG